MRSLKHSDRKPIEREAEDSKRGERKVTNSNWGWPARASDSRMRS